MQKAYDILVNTPFSQSTHPGIKKHRQANEDFQIEPSHLYYRFLPKDSTQYYTLVNDTILNVSNVPFGKEIIEEGDYYKDPELADDFPFTYYYAVIPYDYNFPQNIEHKKLDGLYFTPEEESSQLMPGESYVPQPTSPSTVSLRNSDETEDILELLELEALKLQNSLDEEELALLKFKLPTAPEGASYTYEEAQQQGYEMKDLLIDYEYLAQESSTIAAKEGLKTTGWFRGWYRRVFRPTPWQPSGNISFTDGSGTFGLNKVLVKVRKWGWYVIKRIRTNSNGYFKASSTYTKNVKYAVHFNSRNQFTIKAGSIFWNARYKDYSNYKKRPWNVNFTSGRHHFHAQVYRAAYDYYNRVIYEYGLKRPRYCRISAKYYNCDASEHRAKVLNLLPIAEIRVTRRTTDCTNKQFDRIYASTIHELGHASHREKDKGMFSIFEIGSKNREILKESMALGIETIVTNDFFDDIMTNYTSTKISDVNRGLNRFNEFKQRQAPLEMNEYTPIVDDLIDSSNQNSFDPTYPIDNVSGYTLQEIFNALDDCRDIDCWENNIRNYYTKPQATEDNLTELFNYVRTVRGNSDSW